MDHVLVGRPKILKNLVPSELLQQQKGKNLGIYFQELLLSAVAGGAIESCCCCWFRRTITAT